MSEDKKSNKDKKVGYKKPPKKTQFKKGKSGNPKGRPKKSNPQEKIDNWKPVSAIEASRSYRELMESLKHDD